MREKQEEKKTSFSHCINIFIEWTYHRVDFKGIFFGTIWPITETEQKIKKNLLIAYNI